MDCDRLERSYKCRIIEFVADATHLMSGQLARLSNPIEAARQLRKHPDKKPTVPIQGCWRDYSRLVVSIAQMGYCPKDHDVIILSNRGAGHMALNGLHRACILYSMNEPIPAVIVEEHKIWQLQSSS